MRDLYFHADGDSFFVACELSVRPELRGKPVIVGGDRGIAVAMSPEAKKLGVTRGMPVFRIKKELPQVIILNHHFDLYQEIAGKMHQILSSYFDKVEVYSIDECFALVDPSEIKYWQSEQRLMSELKNEIEKTLGVTYSLGLARTKALAKLASKLEKPGGLVILLSKEDEVRALKKTPIDDIWGIGRRTIPRLTRFGLKNAYDFVKFNGDKFGRPFHDLQKELAGENVLAVTHDSDPRDQKSIQSTRTFHPTSTVPKVIWRELAENAENACANMRELNLVTNKVSFFVKTSEFKYHALEIKLKFYTGDPGVILNAIEPHFLKVLPKNKRIRATGIILHNLTRAEEVPMDLFGEQKKEFKNLAIEEAVDQIRRKHGGNVIKRAASL